MRETGVVLAVGAVLALVSGGLLFVQRLDEANIDMLTTGFTVAIVLVPVAAIVVALAVVVVVMARRQGEVGAGVAGPAVPQAPAIRVDRPAGLQRRKQEADTMLADARAVKAVMLLEDSQREREARPELRPGRWVATEMER